MSTDVGRSTEDNLSVLMSQVEGGSNVKNIKDEFAARVQRGIEYLSDTYGGTTGFYWLSKVDIDSIDTGDNYLCVLGQIEGDFVMSPLFTTEGVQGARERGFYVAVEDRQLYESWAYDLYELLDEEWKRQLTELRKQRYADTLLQQANAGTDDSWYEEA